MGNRIRTPTNLGSSEEPGLETGPSLAERVLWICPILSVLAAGVLFWLFGLVPWTALLAAILLGCPIAIAWALVGARRRRNSSIRGRHR
jgi:hypothetical protein